MALRKKIVLVDNDIRDLTVGKNVLKDYYQVYSLSSAAKLFEFLESTIPDLILLDIDMPVMNGYDNIKILKRDERYADIPVIFLTAMSDEDAELIGLELGAIDYVTKPFFAPLLLKRIENHLHWYQQKTELIPSKRAFL